MDETTLNPYLTFDGDARGAMELYHSVLGGSLDMQSFADTGQETQGDPNRIIHARLESGGITLMASDSMPDQPVGSGRNVSLSLQGTDKDVLMKVFDSLAEGGTVTMPMAEQFWGDTFGMLTDRFGINWMVNITKAG